MQRDYNGYNYHSCLIRVLKSQKNKLVPSYLRFFFAVKKNDWMIHENLFPQTNQYSVISFTRENSKIFNTTSKYFSNFNNKPLASWVAHIAKDFLTCYSCSYYSSILEEIFCKCLDQKYCQRMNVKNAQRYGILLVCLFTIQDRMRRISLLPKICFVYYTCDSNQVLEDIIVLEFSI